MSNFKDVDIGETGWKKYINFERVGDVEVSNVEASEQICGWCLVKRRKWTTGAYNTTG